MEVASQGRVGSQGGGEATVFDTSQFYNQMYNIQKDVMLNQEKKRKEYEQQQATWNSLLEDPGDVWQSDYEQVNKAVTEYNDFIIDMKSKGLDPETLDASLMRKMKQLESAVRKATSAAKDNETYYNQSFNILNQDKAGKYNKEYAAQWLKDYADPNKSPQDRAKMRNESNPFKLNYDIIEFVDKTIPEESIDDTGRKKVIYRDENAHKAIVLSYIQNDPLGEEVFESLKEPGETEIMFAERIAKLGQAKYKPKTDVQPAPVRATSSGKSTTKKANEYGSGVWGDLSIVVEPGANTEYFGSGYNQMAITKNNQELAPIQGIDGGSNNGYRTIPKFKPTGFYLSKGGMDVSVKGYELDDDNNYVTDDEGKPVEIWVSYNQNKAKLKSYLNGFDPLTEFNERNNPTGTTSTSTGSSKFTGVPQGGF